MQQFHLFVRLLESPFASIEIGQGAFAESVVFLPFLHQDLHPFLNLPAFGLPRRFLFEGELGLSDFLADFGDVLRGAAAFGDSFGDTLPFLFDALLGFGDLFLQCVVGRFLRQEALEFGSDFLKGGVAFLNGLPGVEKGTAFRFGFLDLFAFAFQGCELYLKEVPLFVDGFFQRDALRVQPVVPLVHRQKIVQLFSDFLVTPVAGFNFRLASDHRQ